MCTHTHIQYTTYNLHIHACLFAFNSGYGRGRTGIQCFQNLKAIYKGKNVSTQCKYDMKSQSKDAKDL